MIFYDFFFPPDTLTKQVVDIVAIAVALQMYITDTYKYVLHLSLVGSTMCSLTLSS